MPLQTGISHWAGGCSQGITKGLHLLFTKRIGLNSLSVRQKIATAG